MLKGVQSVEPGYTGGKKPNPTYEEVSSGTSGHVEVVEIVYDPEQVAFEELLQVFFGSHDATTLNRQGNDVGEQYRSAIFYTTLRQQQKAQHYIDVLNKSATQRIVTTVEPLKEFYKAESYHKDYFANNRSAGYCQLVIEPKVEKVGKKFKSLLK
jgi:peptide-methionine (S)-S-oxide reductase